MSYNSDKVKVTWGDVDLTQGISSPLEIGKVESPVTYIESEDNDITTVVVKLRDKTIKLPFKSGSESIDKMLNLTEEELLLY